MSERQIPNFEIRPARPGDGQALYDVTWEAVRSQAKGHYSPEQIAGWMGDRTADYYETMIRENATHVALADRQVVGFVDAVPGEVTRLFIRPEFAGRGLGETLLQLGIETARGENGSKIRVESTLNAVTFYEKHGFRKLKAGMFSHGGSTQALDVVEMELVL